MECEWERACGGGSAGAPEANGPGRKVREAPGAALPALRFLFYPADSGREPLRAMSMFSRFLGSASG